MKYEETDRPDYDYEWEEAPTEGEEKEGKEMLFVPLEDYS